MYFHSTLATVDHSKNLDMNYEMIREKSQLKSFADSLSWSFKSVQIFVILRW